MDQDASAILVVGRHADESTALTIALDSVYRVTLASSPDVALSEDIAAFDALVLGSAPCSESSAHCHAVRDRGYVGGLLAICHNAGDGERLLDAGADDFLVAPPSAVEIVARLRGCIRRASARSRLRWGALQVDRMKRTVEFDGRTVALTARECDLLLYLIEAGGRAVSPSTLRKQLLQHKEDRGSNLVEVHLSRLREKLGDRAFLIETVRGVGYRLRH